MTVTRQEKDTFGLIDVPANKLWGAQTQRSLQNFDISGEQQPREIIAALAQVKKASASVNQALGLLGSLIVFVARDTLVAHRLVRRAGTAWIAQGDGRIGADAPIRPMEVAHD